MSFLNDLAKLSVTFFVKFLNVVEYYERVVKVAAKVLHCVLVCAATERCAVSLHAALVA